MLTGTQCYGGPQALLKSEVNVYIAINDAASETGQLLPASWTIQHNNFFSRVYKIAGIVNKQRRHKIFLSVFRRLSIFTAWKTCIPIGKIFLLFCCGQNRLTSGGQLGCSSCCCWTASTVSRLLVSWYRCIGACNVIDY